MMMAGNGSVSACVGEEWTWNIVIETMNKLTIEIKNPTDIDTKQSVEDMMKMKQEEKLLEVSRVSSTTSQASFHSVQFPKQASNDRSKTSNMMKKLETVPPSDLASSSSLFRNFDPLQLEEERKRKYQRYRSNYTSQMRMQRFTSTSWRSREIQHSGQTWGRNNVRRK